MAARLSNPFSRIVEVGWNTVTHVAFYVTVGGSFVNDSFEDYPPDPGPGSRPVIPTEDWSTTWSPVSNNKGTLTQSIDYFRFDQQPESVSIWRNGGTFWLGGDVSDLVIDGGLPAFTDSVTWAPLDHFNNEVYPAPFQDFWKMTPGGDGGGMSVPGEPTVGFDFDTAPKVLFENNAIYTEEPYWASGPGFSVAFGAYSANQITVYIDKTYPVAAMVVRYQGRAFRAAATAIETPAHDLDRLWILFERSTADD